VERDTIRIKGHTRPEDRAVAHRVLVSLQLSYTIEVTGELRKVQAIINLLKALGIKELVQPGRIAGREPRRPAQEQSPPFAKRTNQTDPTLLPYMKYPFTLIKGKS
jgi:acetolactate synthase I/III small subunit